MNYYNEAQSSEQAVKEGLYQWFLKQPCAAEVVQALNKQIETEWQNGFNTCLERRREEESDKAMERIRNERLSEDHCCYCEPHERNEVRCKPFILCEKHVEECIKWQPIIQR